MLYVISQILGWIATAFRAGGMLAKKPMAVKMLVSVGNLGWKIYFIDDDPKNVQSVEEKYPDITGIVFTTKRMGEEE